MKWCSLSYEESTWELEEDVDPGKVKEFEVLQVLPEHIVTVSVRSKQKRLRFMELGIFKGSLTFLIYKFYY